MTSPFPSAGWLVFGRSAAELGGALLSPARLLWHGIAGRGAERARVRRALESQRNPLPPPPPRPPAPRPGNALTIFLSVGEASGEMHGKNLVAELRARRANLRIVGFGGERLRAAGMEVFHPLVARAGMGLVHGLRAIPSHVALAKEFVEHLDRERPAACVFVDNPGFHLILASLARSRGIPAIQYVCPQIWAWAPWRWRRIRRDLALALAIVPFEVPYFAERGIAVRYVGHPLGDEPAPPPADPNDPKRWESPRIAMLPGSRGAELARHVPTMARVAGALAGRIPRATFVMALRDPRLAAQARSILASIEGAPAIEIREGPFDPWLSSAALGIAKSGTNTLEIARARVPLVTFYRLGREVDRAGSKVLLTVPNISLLNLLAAREVVPEIVYVGDAEEGRIVEAAARLLSDPGARRTQLSDLAAILPRFDAPGASARAAEAVLEVAERNSR